MCYQSSLIFNNTSTLFVCDIERSNDSKRETTTTRTRLSFRSEFISYYLKGLQIFRYRCIKDSSGHFPFVLSISTFTSPPILSSALYSSRPRPVDGIKGVRFRFRWAESDPNLGLDSVLPARKKTRKIEKSEEEVMDQQSDKIGWKRSIDNLLT